MSRPHQNHLNEHQATRLQVSHVFAACELDHDASSSDFLVE